MTRHGQVEVRSGKKKKAKVQKASYLFFFYEEFFFSLYEFYFLNISDISCYWKG